MYPAYSPKPHFYLSLTSVVGETQFTILSQAHFTYFTCKFMNFAFWFTLPRKKTAVLLSCFSSFTRPCALSMKASKLTPLSAEFFQSIFTQSICFQFATYCYVAHCFAWKNLFNILC